MWWRMIIVLRLLNVNKVECNECNKNATKKALKMECNECNQMR